MPVGDNEGRFRERAELLDFLLEVSQLTSETLDLDQLLSNVAEIVKEVIPYDLFAILLYSEKTRGLRIRHSIGHRGEITRNLTIQLGEGLTGLAAATRQPVMVNDVQSDPRYLSALDAVRAELVMPMLVRGKLVGVIDLESTRANAFTEQDRSLLALIASRVGVSIDNARLYRRVDRQNRTLRVLAHLSQEFSSILDLDELLTKIASTVRALINFDAFSIFLVDREHHLLRHRFSQRYDERVSVQNIELAKGIVGAAVQSRETIRVPDTLADPRYIASHPDVRAEVAVPLVLQDRVIGVMDLESNHLGFFTDEHVRALSLLAPQIASSVENARLYEELTHSEQRMQEDLRAAHKLQSVLLPRTAPDLAGLEVGLKSRPARGISGDLYDFFEHGGEYSLIAFGDVSGKGAAAALYGALVSGLLRILAPRRQTPAQLMKRLNETLLERKVDAQYATLLLLMWESQAKILTMANAGALPPTICRAGEMIDPRIEGVPLGLLDDREYDQVQFQASKGDLIVLYSDGIEDQLGEGDKDFGRDRLTKRLKRSWHLPPQEVVQAIFSDIDKFRRASPITDDQTVIALKVL